MASRQDHTIFQVNDLPVRTLFILSLLLSAASAALRAQNQNISGGLVFEGEPYLVVNPDNPQHLVVAWMGFVFGQPLSIKTKVSFNGGATWSTAATLPHFGPAWHSADPSLAFGPDGSVFACYIDYRESPDSGAVYVAKSTDGGLHWANPAAAIGAYDDGDKRPVDRPWLAIDRSAGPYRGYQYITTKPAPWIPAPNRPYFVRSADGGVSWTPFRYVDTAGYLVGNFIQAPMAVPAVASDGTLHIAYPSWVLAQNLLPGFYLASSANGGQSFQYQPLRFSTTGAADTLAKLGYRLLADPSDAKHLALVYPFKGGTDLDVYLLETKNGGQTWGDPVRVNDDAQGNGKMQDLVWGDFNAGGDLVVAWRDRRNDPGSGYAAATEIWAAVRWKDSTAFAPNVRLSDAAAPHSAVLEESGNDFMGVALAQDTLLAVWGDVRNGRLNIWFEKRSARSNTSTGVQNLVSEPVPEIGIWPNPAGDQLSVRGEGIEEIAVFDATGHAIIRQKGLQLDLRSAAPGAYFLWVRTRQGDVWKKILRQ